MGLVHMRFMPWTRAARAEDRYLVGRSGLHLRTLHWKPTDSQTPAKAASRRGPKRKRQRFEPFCLSPAQPGACISWCMSQCIVRVSQSNAHLCVFTGTTGTTGDAHRSAQPTSDQGTRDREKKVEEGEEMDAPGWLSCIDKRQ